jgi:hypothetical protein
MGKTRFYFVGVTWDAMKIGMLSATPAMKANHTTSQRFHFLVFISRRLPSNGTVSER